MWATGIASNFPFFPFFFSSLLLTVSVPPFSLWEGEEEKGAFTQERKGPPNDGHFSLQNLLSLPLPFPACVAPQKKKRETTI